MNASHSIDANEEICMKKEEEEKEKDQIPRIYVYIFLTTRVLPSKTLNPLNIAVSFF